MICQTSLLAFASLDLAQASPLVAALIISAALLGLIYWRLRFLARLKQEYSSLSRRWTDDIAYDEGIYEKAKAELGKVVLAVDELVGVSKEQYELNRAGAWSDCLVLELAHRQILSQASAIYEQHRQLGIRSFFASGKLQKAIAKLSSGETTVLKSDFSEQEQKYLSEHFVQQQVSAVGLIRNYCGQRNLAATSIKQFTKAISTKQLDQVSFEQALAEKFYNEGRSCFDMSQAVEAIALPLAPYAQGYSEIVSAWKQMLESWRIDPLVDHSESLAALRGKVVVLKSNLKKIFEIKAQRASLLLKLEVLQSFLDELNTPRLASKQQALLGEPSLEFTENNHKSALKHFADLESALALGEPEAKEFADWALIRYKAACEVLFQAWDCKKYVEVEVVLVEASAVELELSGLAEVYKAYAAQDFLSAKTSLDALKALQAERITASNNLAELRILANEQSEYIRQSAHFVSLSTENAQTRIVQQLAKLEYDAGEPKIAWAVVLERTAALKTKLVGLASGSISNRIIAEKNLYTQVQLSLTGLQEKRNLLVSQIADGWGKQAALIELQKSTTRVNELLAVNVQEGQRQHDWKLVQENVIQAERLLRPIEQIVHADCACHAELGQDLAKFHKELELSGIGDCYAFTVEGTVYGVGIVSNLAAAKPYVSSAYEHYNARKYKLMNKQLLLARQSIFPEHMESWWLCLQMMYCSGNKKAELYALELGYEDGMFNSWVQKHSFLFDKTGILFHPALFLKHNSESKPSRSVPKLRGDAPQRSDYALVF